MSRIALLSMVLLLVACGHSSVIGPLPTVSTSQPLSALLNNQLPSDIEPRSLCHMEFGSNGRRLSFTNSFSTGFPDWTKDYTERYAPLPSTGTINLLVIPIINKSGSDPTQWEKVVRSYAPPLNVVDRALFDMHPEIQDPGETALAADVLKFNPWGSMSQYFEEASCGNLHVSGHVIDFSKYSGVDNYLGWFIPTDPWTSGETEKWGSLPTEVTEALHIVRVAEGYTFMDSHDRADTGGSDFYDCVVCIVADPVGLAGISPDTPNLAQALIMEGGQAETSGGTKTIGAIVAVMVQSFAADPGVIHHELLHCMGLKDIGPIAESFDSIMATGLGSPPGKTQVGNHYHFDDELTPNPYGLAVPDFVPTYLENTWAPNDGSISTRYQNLFYPTAYERYLLGWIPDSVNGIEEVQPSLVPQSLFVPPVTDNKIVVVNPYYSTAPMISHRADLFDSGYDGRFLILEQRGNSGSNHFDLLVDEYAKNSYGTLQATWIDTSVIEQFGLPDYTDELHHQNLYRSQQWESSFGGLTLDAGSSANYSFLTNYTGILTGPTTLSTVLPSCSIQVISSPQEPGESTEVIVSNGNADSTLIDLIDAEDQQTTNNIGFHTYFRDNELSLRRLTAGNDQYECTYEMKDGSSWLNVTPTSGHAPLENWEDHFECSIAKSVLLNGDPPGERLIRVTVENTNTSSIAIAERTIALPSMIDVTSTDDLLATFDEDGTNDFFMSPKPLSTATSDIWTYVKPNGIHNDYWITNSSLQYANNYDAALEMQGALRFIGTGSFKFTFVARHRIQPPEGSNWPDFGNPKSDGDVFSLEMCKADAQGNQGGVWFEVPPKSGEERLEGISAGWPSSTVTYTITLTPTELSTHTLNNSDSFGTNLSKFRVRFRANNTFAFEGVRLESIRVEGV